MEVEDLKTSTEERLKVAFRNEILQSEILYDFPVFTISKSSYLPVLEFLKTQCGFEFLTTLCGLHFPDHEKDKEFGMMVQLHDLKSNHRIRIKTFMPENNLVLPTLTGIWPAANWMERQEFDFFGFEFENHPDLKRILNMDEMNYFPMRKQYPLEDGSRDDKNDSMFGR